MHKTAIARSAELLSILVLGVAATMMGLTACGSDSNKDDGGGEGGAAGKAAEQGGAAGQTSQPSAGSGNEATEPATPIVGTFLVELKEASGSAAAQTAIQGTVADVPTPNLVVWDTVKKANGCALLKKRIPFCESCLDQQTCVEDDVCAPSPTRKDVGKVVVQGLRRTDGGTEIQLSSVGRIYQMTGVALEYPPFDEGDAISLVAEGNELAGFTLESSGIAELKLQGPDPIPMEKGQPLALSWEAATVSGNSRIQVDIDISHHGGQLGRVYCDVADSGSLEISAEQITGLMDMGVSGWPSVTVTRVASDSEELAEGLVKLDVISQIERAFEIPGVVSCADEGDCPSGQTCQSDLKCGS